MAMDSLWLTRLQQFIFKNFKNSKIDKGALLNDGFNDEFIQNALIENYLSTCDNGMCFEMTDKLRYMPVTIAKFKLDPKNKANKFRKDDPQFIKSTFKAAQEYHLACTILIERSSAIFEGKNTLLINPSSMVGAFACELYFKTILMSYGIHKTGHSLMKLFNELPENEKQAILDFFSSEDYNTDNTLRNLDEVSEAFVEIRYSHERTGIVYDALFLGLLLEVLYKRCKLRF